MTGAGSFRRLLGRPLQAPPAGCVGFMVPVHVQCITIRLAEVEALTRNGADKPLERPQFLGRVEVETLHRKSDVWTACGLLNSRPVYPKDRDVRLRRSRYGDCNRDLLSCTADESRIGDGVTAKVSDEGRVDNPANRRIRCHKPTGNRRRGSRPILSPSAGTEHRDGDRNHKEYQLQALVRRHVPDPPRPMSPPLAGAPRPAQSL